MRVIYVRLEHEGGTCSDSWECADCKHRFWPERIEQQQKWTVVCRGSNCYALVDGEGNDLIELETPWPDSLEKVAKAHNVAKQPSEQPKIGDHDCEYDSENEDARCKHCGLTSGEAIKYFESRTRSERAELMSLTDLRDALAAEQEAAADLMVMHREAVNACNSAREQLAAGREKMQLSDAKLARVLSFLLTLFHDDKTAEHQQPLIWKEIETIGDSSSYLLEQLRELRQQLANRDREWRVAVLRKFIFPEQ
jgi:hypothetical protein